jgi:hypothetical protein
MLESQEVAGWITVLLAVAAGAVAYWLEGRSKR